MGDLGGFLSFACNIREIVVPYADVVTLLERLLLVDCEGFALQTATATRWMGGLAKIKTQPLKGCRKRISIVLDPTWNWDRFSATR